MKKRFAILLAVAMTLCASYALAATDVTIDTGLPQFDLHFQTDMDIGVDSIAVDGACVIEFFDPNGDNVHDLQLLATVSSSEDTSFDNKNLINGTEAQCEALFNYLVVSEEGDEQPYEYKIVDMDDGVRALSIINMVVRDEVWVLTIKDGLFVQVFGSYSDFHPISDEDEEYALKLLDSFKFVEKEPVELIDGTVAP